MAKRQKIQARPCQQTKNRSIANRGLELKEITTNAFALGRILILFLPTRHQAGFSGFSERGTRLKIDLPMSESAIDLYNLSKCNVLDESGTTIEAGRLWQDSKAVLVFLRHFACIACRAHAVQVWEHREIYEKNNSKLVFIGNGSPRYIEGFKKSLGLEESTIYTDPSLTTFRFAGLRRGFRSLVSIGSIKNAVALYKQGHRQNQLQAQGDHWQLGGVLVITPKNEIAFHFVSKSLGDLPDSDTITPTE